MVYFSFIGNHDQISSSKEYGAFCNIFDNYKDTVEKVFLLISPGSKTADYNAIALSNIKLIKQLKKDVGINPVQLQLSNPVDFDIVYPVLFDSVLNIIEKNKLQDDEKIINITSGTPTMTACWILLAQSGLIKNAKLIQSFEKKFAKDGRTTQEVNFDIDDFPQIKAPSQLKRRLTITARENEDLKNKLALEELNKKVPDLIGSSKSIMQIKDQLVNDLNSTTDVLILGERGTGKEVVAQSIWKLYRKDNDTNLTSIDCGSLSENLIQSELFGHIKGAFTGADKSRDGLLKKSGNKMIFLDEIGNLPLDGQHKLLRVLENGEIRKLGADEVDNIEIQIIAATNKDVTDGSIFAQDIKDRFDEVIVLPPLRQRKEDIPFLVNHFLKLYTAGFISPIILKQDLLEALYENDWPDNVRGLQKWVQRLARRFDRGGELALKNLPKNHVERFQKPDRQDIFLPEFPLPVPLEEFVERIKESARKKADGNMAEVDRLLKQKEGTEKQRQYRRKKK